MPNKKNIKKNLQLKKDLKLKKRTKKTKIEIKTNAITSDPSESRER